MAAQKIVEVKIINSESLEDLQKQISQLLILGWIAEQFWSYEKPKEPLDYSVYTAKPMIHCCYLLKYADMDSE